MKVKKEDKAKEILVAVDNGYADHKVAWYENGKIMTGKVPAAIATGHNNTTATGDAIGAYSVAGTHYTCGTNSDALINLRHANYPFSDENRVVFTHAINTFGLAGKTIHASVTLPYGDYYNDGGSVNSNAVEKTSANFKANDVAIGDLGWGFLEVASVQVTPEAISAWFDWAMNVDSSMNDDYEEMKDADGSVLVIDIGGSTTDIVSVEMIDGNLSFQSKKSETAKIGVLDAMDKLQSGIARKLEDDGVLDAAGRNQGLTRKAVDQVMKTGGIRLAGKKYDFTELRDKVCADTAQETLNFIRRVTGSTIEYFAIVFVGGGSVVFREQMQKIMPNAEFLDEYANVRGSLKFLNSIRG